MNNIYQNRYEKYKLKYLKLKKEYISKGGGKFWLSDEEINEEKKLKNDLEIARNKLNNTKQRFDAIKIQEENISNNKKKAIEEQKATETYINTLKKNLINNNHTIEYVNKEIIFYENLQNYKVKLYVLQLELQAANKQEILEQIQEIMLLEEVEVLTEELTKAKENVETQTEEEAKLGFNKQLVEALELTLYEVNADKERLKIKEEKTQIQEKIQEKIVLIRTLKKALKIVEKEEKNFVKNHVNKLPSYMNNLTLDEKIEELKKLYEETKISYTEKEKELEDTERRKQEEDNKYKDLEVQYTKIHKEFIKENNNLIFENDDIETILKNIKKLKNFNLSGKVKKIKLSI
jgi:hypothetical protein